MNDVETVKQVVLKVLQSQIPEALPEYAVIPKKTGGSELVLVLHLEQLPYIGFTITMDGVLEKYVQAEVLLGAIIREIVRVYHEEGERIYQGITKAMEELESEGM